MNKQIEIVNIYATLTISVQKNVTTLSIFSHKTWLLFSK